MSHLDPTNPNGIFPHQNKTNDSVFDVIIKKIRAVATSIIQFFCSSKRAQQTLKQKLHQAPITCQHLREEVVRIVNEFRENGREAVSGPCFHLTKKLEKESEELYTKFELLLDKEKKLSKELLDLELRFMSTDFFRDRKIESPQIESCRNAMQRNSQKINVIEEKIKLIDLERSVIQSIAWDAPHHNFDSKDLVYILMEPLKEADLDSVEPALKDKNALSMKDSLLTSFEESFTPASIDQNLRFSPSALKLKIKALSLTRDEIFKTDGIRTKEQIQKCFFKHIGNRLLKTPKEQTLESEILQDISNCINQMKQTANIDSFATQLSDEKGYFLEPENIQPMEQIRVSNIGFQEIEAINEIPPKLRVYDKHNPKLEIFFSNRFCSAGELRGKLLRQELEKLQATESHSSLKEGLEKIIGEYSAIQIKTYALAPIKQTCIDKNYDFSALEKTIDTIYNKGSSCDHALIQKIYEENL